MREQLEKLLPDPKMVEVALAMSLAHRFMHLEGRPLLEALPRAVDNIDDYEWIDGEMLGGIVLGWNFGDGHLNDEQLLDAVQRAVRLRAGRAARGDGGGAAAVRAHDALEDRRRGDGHGRGGKDRRSIRCARYSPSPADRTKRRSRARGEGHRVSGPWQITTRS